VHKAVAELQICMLYLHSLLDETPAMHFLEGAVVVVGVANMKG